MQNVLNLNLKCIKTQVSRRKMYKLILIVIIAGGFVFADSLNNTARIDENSNSVINQYSWANDLSDDDKIEAGRRRGKRNKGDRRRGGGGLR